ncbi:TPA: type IV secretion system protein TraC [Vibrio vulnificus]|uniref:IncF plasmid conjugative transfer pilus assembly protein TraC n=2 Tax=Vibrio vulnificus TaxID=672 RepID=A0AAN1UEF8_VIBVL|nr:type IV secretion system protein TraC [Vibrio vulnificus]ANN29135.1 IncF plasmid conjugative transfer pilus assembly protein TraC [Vibrio vulnificus]ARN68520.1 IncF plasmid conjugative transfer pilus assembly protein TraC [Vibrio vulnificus]ASC59620.1 IncF plasmid conjugative transfer pilus assembly protein TraC [Vibrio vulnificus]AXX62395.1 IncF plasmid conjugative transfer pilus assembly protein TraC [Vibrio vulnificus]HAS6110599.1 type IV secretion system protein TraC [Vibrio vulnificus]
MFRNFFSKPKTGTLGAFYQDVKKHQNHFHHELPYRTFDNNTKIFLNRAAHGIGFKLNILGGANDELIHSLNKLVCEFPQGDKWDYQLSLLGHNKVAHYIEANQALMSKRGGICETLAAKEAQYSQFAATQGFFHKQRHHFDLRDYEAYFFVSTTTKDDESLCDLRATIETAFTQLGIDTQRLTPEGLITFTGDILNFDAMQARPIKRPYNRYDPINQQVMSSDTELLIHRNHIATRHTNHEGIETRTRTVCMGLARTPSDFRLYALPECFASIRNIARHVTCPHVLTLNFRQEVTGNFEHDNNRKISDLTKTVGSSLAMIMPTAKDELEERKGLQKGLSDKEFTISSMVLNLTLFTNQTHQRRDVQAAKEAFSATGLDIRPQIMLQTQSLLTALPFTMSEGLWRDCGVAGKVRSMKSSNLVNFFPIVLDVKRMTGGLLLPTMRGQLSFFDPFNCGSDNKNIALTGGSGAGKSFFVQSMAKSVYAYGGKCWILDKGASYKKLTLMLGGSYLDHRNIYLNPFTHLGKVMDSAKQAKETLQFVNDDGQHENVDPIKEALSNITALFATIASPYQELESYQMAVLGDAIIRAWERKHTKTLVDDVQTALFELSKEYNDDRRIHDIAVQLNKYCSNGIYGDTFNKPSMLDPTIDITTLELDGFNEDVLRPVIFALIVSINQQMYLSGSRSTPKMCIIEEAWSLMSGANAQTRTFINTGYRTARKFGGSFCTVTQGIIDFFANEEARASYDNSDIHMVLRQGDGFDKFLTDNPKAFSEMEERIIKSFPRASDAGYSCVRVKAGGHTSYHRMFSDPFSRACLSTEPHEFEFCENLMNKGMPLMEAINATAEHFYGKEIAEFEHALKAKEAA